MRRGTNGGGGDILGGLSLETKWNFAPDGLAGVFEDNLARIFVIRKDNKG